MRLTQVPHTHNAAGAPSTGDAPHRHDADGTIADIGLHSHGATDTTLSDHEHDGTAVDDANPHSHGLRNQVVDDGDGNTDAAPAHTHSGANVVGVDVRHNHVDNVFPQRHAHGNDNFVNEAVEAHNSHSAGTFAANPLNTWHHKHASNGEVEALDADTPLGANVIAHTHSSTRPYNVKMVADHSHEGVGTDLDGDGFTDINIRVVQHTHAGSGVNTVKPVTAHTHPDGETVTVSIEAHSHGAPDADDPTGSLLGAITPTPIDHSHDTDGKIDIAVRAHTHEAGRHH